MYFTQTNYTNDMEILASPKNLVTFSATVLAGNVTTGDEHGRKYVKCGTLIDGTGAVVTQTGSTGAETLSATPVGIIYKTIDVTIGDMSLKVILEGRIESAKLTL